METLRTWAQNTPITLESWLLSFIGIVLIRTFFEQFSNADHMRYVLIDLPTLVHYGVFYLAVALAFMTVFLFFARISFKEASVLCLFGMSIIWLPPIIDLIAAGPGGHVMTYLFVPANQLILRFFTFFGGHISQGITLGIQIEIIVGLIFTFLYIKTVTKNVTHAVSAAITLYVIIFILLSIPSVISLFLSRDLSTTQTFFTSIVSSKIISANIHPAFYATDTGLLDIAFNKTMTGVFTLCTLIFGSLAFFLGLKDKLLAVLKNSRLDRIVHFMLLILLGVGFAHIFSPAPYFNNWINIQMFLLTCIAFVCAWVFSVLQNDLEDIEIDKISNTNRPLVVNTLSHHDIQVASKIFLLLAFLAAYAASHYTLFFVTFFIFIYYIYSMPPLRLKRFVGLNSFLVSLACLSTILAGFFLVSANKSLLAIPFGLILGIVIFFTAVTNIKDIKDTEGDRQAGIVTVPTLLGKRKAQYVIGTVISLFFLIIPWYFSIPVLLVPSIIAAGLSWYVITKKNYKELQGFAVYMLYLIVIIIVLMIT